jgi:two-component system alkaline phosphatase synthesis response regulator PhoP
MSLPPRAPDADRSVLIVDDDEELLERITNCLSTEGFRVAQASDGIDAVSYLYANRPHVILIDLMMPRMSGVELIEQIRSEPSLAGVAIIAMSGMRDMLARAREAGADEVLHKPLDPTMIVRAIASALK